MKDNNSTSTFFNEMIPEQSSDKEYPIVDNTVEETAHDTLYIDIEEESKPISVEIQNSSTDSDSNASDEIKNEISSIIGSYSESSLSDTTSYTSVQNSSQTVALEFENNNVQRPRSIMLKKQDSNNDKNTTIKQTSPVDTINTSLSEKKDIAPIVSNLVNLFDELDALSQNITDTNVLKAISFVQDRIFEILLANGCSAETDLSGFQIEKHRTIPFAIISEDTPIKRIIRKGLSCNGKIIIKAIVHV